MKIGLGTNVVEFVLSFGYFYIICNNNYNCTNYNRIALPARPNFPLLEVFGYYPYSDSFQEFEKLTQKVRLPAKYNPRSLSICFVSSYTFFF